MLSGAELDNNLNYVLCLSCNFIFTFTDNDVQPGLELNFFVYKQSFASKIFFTSKRRNLTSKCLLEDIF